VYNIIEKDRFSTGKNAAIIRVFALVKSGSQNWAEDPKFGKKAIVQSGSVPPYSLVFPKTCKSPQIRK